MIVDHGRRPGRRIDAATGAFDFLHDRLFDKHQRHPVNLAVLADGRPGWEPTKYSRARWGCKITFRYPTIKLMDDAAGHGSGQTTVRSRTPLDG